MHIYIELAHLPEVENDLLLPEECLAMGEIVHLRKNERYKQVGDKPDCVCYVKEGRVHAKRGTINGSQKWMFIIPKGYFIYETIFFSGLPILLDMPCELPTTLVVFKHNLVWQLMQENKAFLRAITYSITWKTHVLSRDLLSRTTKSGMERLKATLYHLALPPDSDGCRSVEYSQYDLADIVGLHRVQVNRLLKELATAGLISIGRRKIILLPSFSKPML